MKTTTTWLPDPALAAPTVTGRVYDAAGNCLDPGCGGNVLWPCEHDTVTSFGIHGNPAPIIWPAEPAPPGETPAAVLDCSFLGNYLITLDRRDLQRFVNWFEDVMGGGGEITSQLARFIDQHPEIR